MATIPNNMTGFMKPVPQTYEDYAGMNVSPLLSQAQWNVGDGSNVNGSLGSGFSNLSSYGMPPPPTVGGFGGIPYNSITPGASTAVSTGFQPSAWQRLTGYVDPATDKQVTGWGGLALGGASFLTNAYLGMQQYGIAKDTLEQNKRQFKLNYDAQRSMTNSALEDRQRRRMQERPDLAMPVADYMAKWGIK